jgi:hypothetical protein
MSYIVASLPPVKCFVKREFLYNFTKGHGEFEPAIWVSLKALRGQVFRIESLLPNYGALYDKLPIHAYVWHTEALELPDLPVDALQLWDCMGYRFTIVEKIGLRNLGVKFLGKDKLLSTGQAFLEGALQLVGNVKRQSSAQFKRLRDSNTVSRQSVHMDLKSTRELTKAVGVLTKNLLNLRENSISDPRLEVSHVAPVAVSS